MSAEPLPDDVDLENAHRAAHGRPPLSAAEIAQLTPDADAQPASATTPILRLASSVTPRELEPLWPGVLWIGKPTLFAGDPGLGKSIAAIDCVARATRGTPWPCESAEREPVDALMMTAEDDIEDTVVPRLIAAGADLARISFLTGVRETDDDGASRERMLLLDEHLDVLRQSVQDRQRITKLIVVDPLSAFLGKTDSHNNAETRGLLAGLGRIATELRFALLAITHLNKASGANALYRVTGSLAFVAAARAVFAIARDPEDASRRLMLPVKCNLAPDSYGFSYSVSVADNDAPHVRWGDTRVTRAIEEVLTQAPSPREQAVIERSNDVASWLREQLAAEPQPAASMWNGAAQRGFSRRDVERTKRALGVTAEPMGYRGAWHWRLPEGRTAPAQTFTDG